MTWEQVTEKMQNYFPGLNVKAGRFIFWRPGWRTQNTDPLTDMHIRSFQIKLYEDKAPLDIIAEVQKYPRRHPDDPELLIFCPIVDDYTAQDWQCLELPFTVEEKPLQAVEGKPGA